jgi:hypothetical protein
VRKRPRVPFELKGSAGRERLGLWGMGRGPALKKEESYVEKL